MYVQFYNRKELVVLIYSVCVCIYVCLFASTSLSVSALYLVFLTFLYVPHDISIGSWDVFMDHGVYGLLLSETLRICSYIRIVFLHAHRPFISTSNPHQRKSHQQPV